MELGLILDTYCVVRPPTVSIRQTPVLAFVLRCPVGPDEMSFVATWPNRLPSTFANCAPTLAAHHHRRRHLLFAGCRPVFVILIVILILIAISMVMVMAFVGHHHHHHHHHHDHQKILDPIH